jgi:cytochrome c556
MIRAIILVVAGAVAGGFAGNTLAHRLAAPHRHPRAVMTLLGFHHDRLDAATKAGHCADVATERARLGFLQQEIALAFPLAYRQEAGFRKSADALGSALQSGADGTAADGTAAAGTIAVQTTAAPSACSAAAAQFKKISDACDECHRVYDPA